MDVWLPVLGGALALVAMCTYAAAALWAHARLPRIQPPATLARALVLGALVPACGCTALAIARRAGPRERAPFLVAAYAASALLVGAAWFLGGALAAIGVLALALVAAALARALPAGAPPPRVRLDDLLLRRDASPLRDAAPYLASYGAPALAVGALVGATAALAPAWLKGAAFAALAIALAAPRGDLAADHGQPFARRVFALHVAFAVAGGLMVAALAAVRS